MNPATIPHDAEAELAVVGGLLLDADVAAPILEREGIGPAHFYDLRHRRAFEACQTLRGEGKPVVLPAVLARVKDKSATDWRTFLASAENATPSAHSVIFYVEQLIDQHHRRTALDVSRRIAEAAQSDSPGDVLADAQTALDVATRLFFTSGLPPIVDAAEFVAEPLPQPPELVSGILHQGAKLVLGGGSKSFKTWCLLDLAVSVAHGLPWLNCETQAGRVLFLNFEIQPHAWQRRIAAVAQAKGIKVKPGAISLWNLRGHAADFRDLLPRITKQAQNASFALIVLDPIYKLYGSTDENKAGDVAALMNGLEKLAVDTDAAVAFGAHFAKGNASQKEAIDRVSGSGVFARDPDSILTFTKHEEEEAFTVEAILRNHAHVKPFAVRWQFPLMRRADELDPARLKQPGRKPRLAIAAILVAIKETTPEKPVSATEWANRIGIARTTLTGYLTELNSSGLIKTAGEGSSSRRYLSEKGQQFLEGRPGRTGTQGQLGPRGEASGPARALSAVRRWPRGHFSDSEHRLERHANGELCPGTHRGAALGCRGLRSQSPRSAVASPRHRGIPHTIGKTIMKNLRALITALLCTLTTVTAFAAAPQARLPGRADLSKITSRADLDAVIAATPGAPLK